MQIRYRKKVKSIIILILIGVVIISYFNFVDLIIDRPNNYFEIDPDFLVLPNNSVIISGKKEVFQLYKYNNGKSEHIPTTYHTTTPFLFKGKVVGLVNQNGDQNVLTTNVELNNMLNFEPVERVFSFDNGYLMVVKIWHDRNVYILNLKTNTNKVLLENTERVHSVAYSLQYNFLVLHHDDKLSIVDFNGKSSAPIIIANVAGSKASPFISGSDLYFASNATSEYHKLFKINLRDSTFSSKEIYRSDHDLLMPQVNDKYLFFVKVINNEYLLKKVGFDNLIEESVTQRGVVYNYSLNQSGNIFVAYSDFYTPKSLKIFDEKNKTQYNLTGTSIDYRLTIKFIERGLGRSAAYLMIPPGTVSKGTILYFHPGLHSDFSPRFDPLLANLCLEGYLIIAPNYPMSFGYGMSFQNLSVSDAVMDMVRWRQIISKAYPAKPVFFLASSSGNIIMEQSLSDDNDVAASASLFGIPTGYPILTTVPQLFILGVNDPVVQYDERINFLKAAQRNNERIDVLAYENEGHWIRSSKNMRKAVKKISYFFQKNSQVQSLRD